MTLVHRRRVPARPAFTGRARARPARDSPENTDEPGG